MDAVDPSAEPPEPVLIPPDALSAPALTGIIESYVLREGTDYGEREVSFEVKCAEIRAMLQRREIGIVWNPADESLHLLDRSALRKAGLS